LTAEGQEQGREDVLGKGDSKLEGLREHCKLPQQGSEQSPVPESASSGHKCCLVPVSQI